MSETIRKVLAHQARLQVFFYGGEEPTELTEFVNSMSYETGPRAGNGLLDVDLVGAPIYLDFAYMWRVIFRDGKVLDVHPSNVSWTTEWATSRSVPE